MIVCMCNRRSQHPSMRDANDPPWLKKRVPQHWQSEAVGTPKYGLGVSGADKARRGTASSRGANHAGNAVLASTTWPARSGARSASRVLRQIS